MVGKRKCVWWQVWLFGKAVDCNTVAYGSVLFVFVLQSWIVTIFAGRKVMLAVHLSPAQLDR